MNQFESPSTRFACEPHAEHAGMPAPKLMSRPGLGGRLHSVNSSYFDQKPRHAAASPTATLVADLSQNFHLGASPAVPTPRRSLMRQFSYTAVDAFVQLPHEPATPGDQPDSPGDVMETSPIPSVPRKTLSRTTSMFEPGQLRPPTDHRVISQAFNVRPQLQRPALLNRQTFSHCRNVIPEKKSTFTSSALANDKENDLVDRFEDSPKKTPRKFFGIPVSFGHKHGVSSPPALEEFERSPLGPISSNRSIRPPNFRRIQSMITRNDEFLAPELLAHQRTPELYHRHTTGQLTSPVVEPASVESRLLPSFESKSDPLKRISGATFAKVLDGHYSAAYEKLEIIDCRFPHEFAGGHIPNAINIDSLPAMREHALLTAPTGKKTLIILHCEHSELRAPRFALLLRNEDRKLNEARYPMLYYPEIYLLDGGYQKFHREFRPYLRDAGYVAQNDPTVKPISSRCMQEFRKQAKFQRTQSYTYGQDSPLAGGQKMKRETSFKLSGFNTAQTTVESSEISDATGDTDTSMMDVDDLADSSFADEAERTAPATTEPAFFSGRLFPGRMPSY